MEGPRIPQENELQAVLQFLDRSLRPDATWPISSEYPTALTKSNIHNMRIVTDQDQVVSHAVLKPLIIKSPLMILKAGAIGSVVTAQDHRGQGLSTQVIQGCLDEARAQDCDLAILWTNLYDFYRKMGFELAGFEESVIIEKEFIAPEARSLKFMQGCQVSPEAILRVYSQHSVCTARTAEDIRKFLQIPKTQLYTAWDSTGALVAYAVEGKGADLTDYIHEWGGKVSAIVALLSWVRKSKGRPITLISPNHSVNLLLALQRYPVTINQGFLGMIKIVNHDQFFQKIHRAAKTLGISDFILDKTPQGIQVGIGSETRTYADEKDFVQMALGPHCEFGGVPSTNEKLSRLFPLPLWIWGWDSI